MRKNLLAVVLAASLSPFIAQAQSGSLALTSTPNSSVGQGLNWYISTPQFTFFQGNGGQFDGKLAFTMVNLGLDVSVWNLRVSTPDNTGEFLLGHLYDGATRDPFNSITPGISLTGEGRAPNNPGGWFIVHNISRSDAGWVTQADVEFFQVDSIGSPEGVHGRFLYTVPEPSVWAWIGIIALLIILRAVERSQNSSG